MNVRPWRWALLQAIAVTSLLFAGCSTISSRINENKAAYNALPASARALVAEGKIREGMSPSTVAIAWGSPDQKSVGSVHGRHSETWVYLAYRDAYPPYPYGGGYYGGGFSGRIGFHRHGRHFFYAEPFCDPFLYSSVVQIPYPYKTVTFQSGRVVAYQLLYPPLR